MIKKILAILITLLATVAPHAAAAPVDTIPATRRIAPVVVRIGGSAVMNLAMTEVLKSSIHEMRPNRHDNHSWPSRHTSWAFTAASVVSHELYRHSPWWVVGAHTAANAMALQRTFSRNHYPKDVLGGAAVGLVSTEVAYLVSDLIFPGSAPRLENAADEWLPSFDATTSALFPIGDIAPGTTVRTGYGASLRFTLPCSDRWAITAAYTMTSFPVYVGDVFRSMLNSGGLSLGAACHWSLPAARWGAEARLMPGVARNFGADGVSHPGWSFTLDAAAAATCAITPSFTLGAEAGYTLRTLGHALNAISLSLISRVRF